MRQFSAETYRGRRLSFTAHVKADHVKSWAGLWMRVDNQRATDRAHRTLAFDNMQGRSIRGTKDWRRYSAWSSMYTEEATEIYLGILLTGAGAVWLSSDVVEVVPTTVRTTNTLQHREPF